MSRRPQSWYLPGRAAARSGPRARIALTRIATVTAIATLAAMPSVSAVAGTPAGTGASPPATAAAAANPPPAVVPALRQWTGGTGQFTLGPQTRIVVNDQQWQALGADARTFAGDVAAITGATLPVVTGSAPSPGDLYLASGAAGLPAQGYDLDVSDVVRITGADGTGVFYGEQTIEQMLKLDPQHVSLPRGSARDWPGYQYRGVMLDMGRHYYSPAYVEREIREAAWHKLDSVHLHLTEYNAFRLQSSTYPGLADARSYSHADLAAFTAEARRYHVTLAPEIDVPAHSTAIADYDPSLKFDCPSLAGGFTLDVTKPQTEQFIDGLLKEFAPLFPDAPVFHLGGDEYPSLSQQQSCPELVNYAKANGFASTEDVFVSFLNRLAADVQALGKRPEIWNWWDVVGGATTAPSKDIIIDAWTGSADAYLSAGYDTVSSPDNLLYVTPEAPPGGSIEPDDQYLYQSWVPPADPHLEGFEISRWSDNAVGQPDSYFDWFASRPETVLAARAWGGPRAASVFAFEDQADRVGAAPGIPGNGPPGAVQLTGTPYGTSPAWGGTGNTFDKAFDGDVSTFFDYSQADGGYTGIDLGPGKAAPVTAIRFVPRSNQPGRMVGGVFQGCTDGPASGCHTLATVPWRPSYEWTELPVYDPAPYRWLRYVSPDGGFCDVGEIQFYTAPAAAASVTVTAPPALHALGTNSVTTTITNTSDTPLIGVRAQLAASALSDEGALSAQAAGSSTIAALPPHQSAGITWHLDAPLTAPSGTYALTGSATWRAGPAADSGIDQAEGFAQATLPEAVSAKVTPPAVQLPAGGSAQATLQISSSAGAPVTVAWQAAPPAGSGVTVTPATGSATVPAGGQVSATITAKAAGRPGVTSVPITMTATGAGQTVAVASPSLQVSVPYPSLAAAYGNTGITDDGDISPPGLDGGLDGDGSSLSAEQLASIGITPGAPFSYGGVTFTWPAASAGQPDNVLADGQVIQLAGSGQTLGLLTTGTYFPPPGTVTVTYTDGTTSTATITDTDWQASPPQGSEVAVTTTYHNWTGSGRVNRDAYLYFHAVPLDPSKTVASVTLPAIGDHATGGTPALHVFAMAIG